MFKKGCSVYDEQGKKPRGGLGVKERPGLGAESVSGYKRGVQYMMNRGRNLKVVLVLTKYLV